MLIEVLITIAIITLVSGAVAIAAFKYWQQAKVSTARESARTIRHAVRAAALEGGDECPTLESLIAAGTLDEEGARRDPWGSAWKISCDGQRVVVQSIGKDHQAGTEDDIVVPSPAEKPVEP